MPFYSAEDIARFHETRERINGEKRRQGRARDTVSRSDFNELVHLARETDSETSREAQRGMQEALLLAGTGIRLYQYLARAQAAQGAARLAVYTARVALGIQRNVGLIQTLTGVARSRLMRHLLTAAEAREAVEVAQLREWLIDAFNLDEATAERIALDQSRKYAALQREAELVAQGHTQYMWATMRDDKVRPTHRVNEGRIFGWDKPSLITGHPGHDPNCRCYPVPVIRRRPG